MHVKDAIATKQKVALWANCAPDEAVINEFNSIEQIYIRFQAPFAFNFI